MATTETVRGDLAARSNQDQAGSEVATAQPTIRQLVDTMQHQFARALPAHIGGAEGGQRFARLALTTLNTVPKLDRCTPASLLGALMTCAQLGLEPNTPTGEAYLIPYGDVATFVPGYQGICKLAWQSGQVAEMYAEPVFSNDHFSYHLGLNRDLVHEPAKGERGDLAGCYAVVKLIGGGTHFAYMTAAELAAHRDRYSKQRGGNNTKSPWEEGYWMHRKTVLKQVLKLIPKSTAMSQALAQDGAVRLDIDPGALDNILEGVLVDDDDSDGAAS